MSHRLWSIAFLKPQIPQLFYKTYLVKVYDLLTQEGLIEAQSTNGYFVTENEEILGMLKPSFAHTYCKDFIHLMQSIGISKEEAIELLKEE